MQVEFTDSKGKKWYMDQAERFNAFGFNKFKGWMCNSGYSGIIIREPDGSIKRSYSCHDVPLGNIETGFKLFDGPVVCTTPACVSSADSKNTKKETTMKPLFFICGPRTRSSIFLKLWLLGLSNIMVCCL